jgi:hypothetical protein
MRGLSKLTPAETECGEPCGCKCLEVSLLAGNDTEVSAQTNTGANVCECKTLKNAETP